LARTSHTWTSLPAFQDHAHPKSLPCSRASDAALLNAITAKQRGRLIGCYTAQINAGHTSLALLYLAVLEDKLHCNLKLPV